MARGLLVLGILCLLVTVMEAADNTTLRVSTILTSPFVMLKAETSDVEEYEGYIVDLVKRIAEVVGVRYKLHLVKDGRYGARDKDGNWNGMIGELIRKEADVAAAPLTITSNRERVVDFTKPFMSSDIMPVVASVKDSKTDIFMIVNVFNFKVWILLIIAYVVVCLVMWLLNRYNPHEKSRGKDGSTTFNLAGSFWFGISTFMWQGYEQRPRSHAGRVLASFWFVFAVMALLLFCAGLFHNLSTHQTISPFESITDLAKDKSYEFGTIEGGAIMSFFRTSTIALYERIWSRMTSFKPSAFVRSTPEGFERVRNSKYVFLTESHVIDYVIANEPCGTLVTFGGPLDSKGFGLASPLGSPIRERLNLAILELRENGYLHKLEAKWFRGTCPPSSGKSDHNPWRDYPGIVVTEKMFAFPMIFLLVGVVLTVLVCITETLHNSKRRLSSNKSSLEEG